MYHDSDNNVVSEPGRFGVETACGTAAIDIGIGRLQNIEWYAMPMKRAHTEHSLMLYRIFVMSRGDQATMNRRA